LAGGSGSAIGSDALEVKTNRFLDELTKLTQGLADDTDAWKIGT
jgi:hypothetical protein